MKKKFSQIYCVCPWRVAPNVGRALRRNSVITSCNDELGKFIQIIQIWKRKQTYKGLSRNDVTFLGGEGGQPKSDEK